MRPLLPLVLLLAGCGAPPTAPAPAPAQAVTVVAVAEAAVVRSTSAVGALVPREEAVVTNAGAAGIIARLAVEVGDRVVAGQELVVLDDRDVTVREAQLTADRARAVAQLAQAEAQVAEASASAEDARRSLVRAEGLAPGGLVAAETLDARQSAAAAAEARLAGARASVAVARAEQARLEAVAGELVIARSRTRLTAPAAGLVLTRSARPGAAAGPGEPLLTLALGGVIEARAEVPEDALLGVAVGQAVTVEQAGRSWPGTVRLVEPQVEPTRRCGFVRVDLGPAGGDLHPGAAVVVRLVTAQERGPVVPLAAVRQGAEGASVLIAQGGPPGADGRFAATVARVPVTLGLEDGSRAVLRTGPPVGAWVIGTAPDLVTVGSPCIAVTGP